MLKVPVTEKDHIQGDPKAPVILVEYGDYECPHCGHAYPVVKRVQKRLGRQLAFVFRNFPLNEIHPDAESAAESTEFAAAQNKYWEMHDGIFENQDKLSDAFLLELAESLSLNGQSLQEALNDEEFAGKVKEDFTGGVRSGVNGTPTFFINGHRYDGAVDEDDLVEAIEGRILKP
jgi:protein-disulfide isomerase